MSRPSHNLGRPRHPLPFLKKRLSFLKKRLPRWSGKLSKSRSKQLRLSSEYLAEFRVPATHILQLWHDAQARVLPSLLILGQYTRLADGNAPGSLLAHHNLTQLTKDLNPSLQQTQGTLHNSSFSANCEPILFVYQLIHSCMSCPLTGHR